MNSALDCLCNGFGKVLWSLTGQVLVASLVSIRQNNPSATVPAVAVSPAEIIIIASLNRVLDAMYALKDTSPLIGSSPHLRAVQIN